MAASRFAVRGDVQAFALFFFGHAQADGQVDDLVGDERHHRRPDDGPEHALSWIHTCAADASSPGSPHLLVT
jgi:hypothetical protein